MTPFHALALLFVLVTLCRCQQEKLSGPYNTTVVSMGNCRDGAGTGEVQISQRMSRTKNKTTCHSGWISLPYGYNDNIQEIWEISSMGSTGGWKRNFLKFHNKKACSDTKRLYPQWFGVFEIKMNKSRDAIHCPLPEGNYTWDCQQLNDVQFVNVPELIYGQYRATIKYYRQGVNIGCFMFVSDIHPRVHTAKRGK